VSAKADKLRQGRIAALQTHLRSASGQPNPETLSRSYGLDLPMVERIIKEVCRDRV
jgi:hypothetical protein